MTLYSIVALLAIGVLSTPTIQAGVTLTSVTDFNDFVDVFKRLGRTDEKIRFAEAIWGEIRADYAEDLDKATKLYRQFPTIIGTNAAAEQKQAALELQQEIRHYLIVKNAQLLANTWNGDEFPDTAVIRNFCNNLTANYELQMVHDIYGRAIDEVYPLRSTEILAALLHNIYDLKDPLALQVMVNAELHLYWKFLSTNGVNDDYLFNTALYLYQVINNSLYKTLSIVTQRRIARAIDTLPSTLRNFYFQEIFCLTNRNQSQVLFSQDYYDYDANRRYVFAYKYENTSPSGAFVGWKMDTKAQATSWPTNLSGDVSFRLKNNNTSTYMYLDHDIMTLRDIVFLSRSSIVQPKNSEWKIKFVENELIFHQDGFVMCVDEKAYDTSRLYVTGFNDYLHKSTYKPCQWEAKKCN